MQKLGIVVAAIIVLNTPLSLLAQDPQFTQFYANPLYLNPALTGASELTRVGVGYRNQWPALGYNFRTYYAYVDHFSPWYNSGVGLAVMSDRAGDLSLGFSGVHLSYAYKLWLSPNWAFRPGFSVGYLNYGLDASRIRASSQFGPDGSYDPTAATGLAVNETLHLLDLGVGGVFHGKNLWVGYSVYHLNFPNQSLIGSEDQMALRHSAHGGYKWKFSSQMVEGRFFMEERERSLVAAVNYKNQGLSHQADVGAYYIFEPLLVGLWYSGFVTPRVDGTGINNESINGLIGVKTGGGFYFGYSYDFPLTELRPAHEVSITYEFSTRDPRKPDKYKMRLPCPWL